MMILRCSIVQDGPSDGLFTEGAFALVEGDYTEDSTFLVYAMGHPPSETRETSRSVLLYVVEYSQADVVCIGQYTGMSTFLGKAPRRPSRM